MNNQNKIKTKNDAKHDTKFEKKTMYLEALYLTKLYVCTRNLAHN